jgi:hypothetical protein
MDSEQKFGMAQQLRVIDFGLISDVVGCPPALASWRKDILSQRAMILNSRAQEGVHRKDT